MSLIQEFKQFAMRGNVVDMAVGVVVGTAFGKIVSSLVSDIIMPPLAGLTGGVNFSNLVFTIRTAQDSQPAVTLNYGAFLNTIFDFLIIAFAIFVAVKAMNKLRRTEDAPTTKECPHCLSKIPAKATKCAYCTAEVKY